MIGNYEKNQEKYKKILEFVNGIKDEKLKQEIKAIVEKYQIAISCMEQEEAEKLIRDGVKYGNSERVRKSLHNIIALNSEEPKDNGYAMYNVKSDR